MNGVINGRDEHLRMCSAIVSHALSNGKKSTLCESHESPENPKSCPKHKCNYWLITPNKHFALKLISFKSGQLQNNTADGAMSISINCVINLITSHYKLSISQVTRKSKSCC